jgi:hypothetical protein
MSMDIAGIENKNLELLGELGEIRPFIKARILTVIRIAAIFAQESV